jgi:hypothetical protein
MTVGANRDPRAGETDRRDVPNDVGITGGYLLKSLKNERVVPGAIRRLSEA